MHPHTSRKTSTSIIPTKYVKAEGMKKQEMAENVEKRRGATSKSFICSERRAEVAERTNRLIILSGEPQLARSSWIVEFQDILRSF